MTHLHRARRYRSMGKPHCVTLRCRCGAEEPYGLWFRAEAAPVPEGWDPIHFRKHAYRKAEACARRWLLHVRRLHRLWDRWDARRGENS